MNRPISTRTHGALDYAWVSAAASAAGATDATHATARFVRSSSVVAGINSMLTDYEAGVLRLMPMRVHLAVDFVIGAALVLSPLFLPKSGRRSVVLSVALGLTACAASLLTDARDRKRSAGFAPSYELSEAVVDPDVAPQTSPAESSRIRLHVEASVRLIQAHSKKAVEPFFGAGRLEPLADRKDGDIWNSLSPSSGPVPTQRIGGFGGKVVADYLCAVRFGERDQLRAHLDTGIGVVHYYRVPVREGFDNELFLAAIGATIIA